MAPTAITLGAASARGFGAFTSLGSGSGWIFTYYGTSTTMLPGPLYFDASGQIVSLGQASSKTNILTISRSGALISQISDISNNMPVNNDNSCFFDTTNGFLYYTNTVNSGIGVAKVTPSSLSYSWTRYTQGNGFSNSSPESRGVAVDSSQNVYTCGNFRRDDGCCSFSYFSTVVKLNSSGTQTNLLSYTPTGAPSVFRAIILTSSGTPVVVGYHYTGSPTYSTIIASLTSTLGVSWQRKYAIGTSGIYFFSIARDSSNNYYVCGYVDNTSSIIILKYNSSGALQWQRMYSYASGVQPEKIAVSSSGDIYVTGTLSVSTTNSIVLLKYDNSGTLQWQRFFRPVNMGGSQGGAILLDEINNRVIFCNSTTGSSLGNGFIRLIFSYSMDGKKLGSFTITGSQSYSITAGTGTSSTPAGTDSASTYGVGGTTGSTGVGPTLNFSSVSFSSALTVL